MIPKLHYIPQGNSAKELLENIQKACTSGAELVQLGLKNLSDKKFLKLAEEAREITSHYQTRLLLNGNLKIAKEIKADGVHLEKMDICPSQARKELYPWQIIGGTANSLQNCETLIAKEVNYISLGPFRATKVEDNSLKILGLNGYTAIIETLKTDIPIIGFGGIRIADVTAILETGVSGLRLSEEITQNFDAIKIYNQLLKASSTEEQRHTFK
jgi:thiamine-phosphate pyrophosphorylase